MSEKTVTTKLTGAQITMVVKEMRKIGIREWANAVDQMLRCKMDKLDIFDLGEKMVDYDSCIVGEAHGKKSCYHCGECDEFAMDFYHITQASHTDYENGDDNNEKHYISLDTEDKPKMFNKLMEFIGHFQKAHA